MPINSDEFPMKNLDLRLVLGARFEVFKGHLSKMGDPWGMHGWNTKKWKTRGKNTISQQKPWENMISQD